MSLDVQSYHPEEFGRKEVRPKRTHEMVPDDLVGQPIYPTPVERLQSLQLDATKLVEQQLKLGKNPETLLESAMRKYESASFNRVQDIANDDQDKITNVMIREGITARAEINALIPAVAKARVTAQAKEQLSPMGYIDSLRDHLQVAEQIIHAQQEQDKDTYDQYAMQHAIDDAKMFKKMIEEAATLSHEKSAWKDPKKDWPDVDAIITKQKEERANLQTAKDQRAGMPFWNILEKRRLDQTIKTLETNVQKLSQQEKDANDEIKAVPENINKNDLDGALLIAARELGLENRMVPYDKQEEKKLMDRLEKIAGEPGQSKGTRLRRRWAELGKQVMKMNEENRIRPEPRRGSYEPIITNRAIQEQQKQTG